MRSVTALLCNTRRLVPTGTLSGLSGTAISRLPTSVLREFSSATSSAGGVQTLEFKAETLKLLNIVTHSLYTDKEVFIRELVSNASDALEKLRFLQSTGKVSDVVDTDKPLAISITVDAKSSTITIEDSGIGMTRQQVIDNLGTIAHSGSAEFKKEAGQEQALLGQFGVGFYSSFIVSDSVEVFTRSYNPNAKGCHWKSSGLGTFTLEEVDDVPRGTKIICHLKPDSLDFCSLEKLKELVEKWSTFVSFPLSVGAEGQEAKRIGGHEPLWLKSSATADEHEAFFKHISGQSWSKPIYSLMYHSDSPLSIKSVLYVPETAPSRFSGQTDEGGVALHSKRVLVTRTPDKLIPRWMKFVRGVVDCEDMPMNISRESMQDSLLMEKLSAAVVRKFLKFLADQANADKTKFMTFYRQFDRYLKEGLLEDMQKGAKFQEAILKLLYFDSTQSSANDMTTLDQYVTAMLPTQKNIYYFTASNRNKRLPCESSGYYNQQFSTAILSYLSDGTR